MCKEYTLLPTFHTYFYVVVRAFCALSFLQIPQKRVKIRGLTVAMNRTTIRLIVIQMTYKSTKTQFVI